MIFREGFGQVLGVIVLEILKILTFDSLWFFLLLILGGIVSIMYDFKTAFWTVTLVYRFNIRKLVF